MDTPQHTHDDLPAQGPAVPPLENLQLLYMRSILIGAGYIEWDGSAPQPEPFMDVWEMLGRARHLHELQTGLTDAETYGEWIEGHCEQEEVAGLLNNLVLVVAPRPASVS